MLILRDIGFLKIVRFNRILDSVSGLTPRVLPMRLRELEDEGYIECVGGKREPLIVVWKLTEKGRDTLPILIHITAFGSKWHADVVFEDKKPRSLNEIFPQQEVSRIMMGIR
jgi:DNA-binding HxlR family transcriptional regulator